MPAKIIAAPPANSARRFVESLAVADARRDHLREIGQLASNPSEHTTDLDEVDRGRR